MISIVTAYYNRKKLLLNTLDTIRKSNVKDYEVIIVDDGSSDEHRLEDILPVYPEIKLIRVNSDQKWWINPCISFNIGFKEAKGDVIILQNPECKHVGDILSKSSEVRDGEYFTFACYSIDRDTTQENKEFKIVNKSASFDGELAWYNHSIYRPKAYHFCASITKNDLQKLNGFDERYAHGIAYDDDEFLHRIKKSGIKVSIIDEPYVIHQWHERVNYGHLDIDNLINKNKKLYYEYTINND